jgi:uncharacterized membrane protein YfhO
MKRKRIQNDNNSRLKTKQVKDKSKAEKKESKQVNELNSVTFYDKYIAKYNIFVLITLILFIGIIAFGKFFTGEYLFYFKDIGSDSLNQDYPAILQKVRFLKEGFISDWSFFAGMGEPLHNQYPVDPYTGLRVLEQKAGAALFGADYFVFGNFLRKFVFSFLLTGIIFYYYLRTLSVRKFTALIGSLIMAFSGFIVLGSSWGFSGHVMKAVFLLFAFEQLYVKNRWYFFPFAVIWLSGNIFILYIYGLFLILYMIFRIAYEHKDSITDIIKLTGKMIGLAVIGLLMNMVNISSTFLKMFNSPRVSGNASYSEILSEGGQIIEQGNFASTSLLRFFSNDILGSGSQFQGWNNYLEAPVFYIGLLTLLVFPQIFFFLKKRERIVFGSFFAFWLLTMLFPVIRHTMLAYTGDYFRYGFDFFIPFVLLFYAVFSINKIEQEFKINIALLTGTMAVLLFVLLFPYGSLADTAIDKEIRIKILILLLIYFLLLILYSYKKYRSAAQIALLIVLVFELSSFSKQSYSERNPLKGNELRKDAAGYADGTIEAVKYINQVEDSKFFRTEKDYQSGKAQHSSLNDAQAQAYFGTTSYSSFNQINYIRFLDETGIIQKGDEIATRWSPGLRGLPLFQTFGNVKYHLSKSAKPEFIRFGYDSIANIAGITILKNRFYLPFGYTYDSFIEYDDFQKLITFQINEQSLTLIYTDLSRTVEVEKLNNMLTQLQALVNVEFTNRELFRDAVMAQIGIEETEKYFLQIAKYSTNNFKMQTALLNAFIYETDLNSDLTGLKKIDLSDSSAIVPAHKFNFDVYKEMLNKLKKDTFKIDEFSHSKITGTIELNQKKLLFFTIPYDEGWKATVNGVNADIKRFNLGFSGLILDPGEYEVVLFFERPHKKISKLVSILSIVSFWLFMLYYLYTKRLKKN